LVTVTFLLGVFFVGRGLRESYRRPDPGSLWPDSALGLEVQEYSGTRHFIVWSTECKWCRRQLGHVSRVYENRDTPSLWFLVVDDSEGAQAALAELEAQWSLAFRERTDLERVIGPVVTPTHYLVEGARVLARHAGYLTAPELARFLSERQPPER
jgi:hypothetical protein